MQSIAMVIAKHPPETDDRRGAVAAPSAAPSAQSFLVLTTLRPR
jgi:hypothetical protein